MTSLIDTSSERVKRIGSKPINAIAVAKINACEVERGKTPLDPATRPPNKGPNIWPNDALNV